MKILIAGDLVPTVSNVEEFKKSNFIDGLGEEFKKIWLNADFRLFNLECPLGENLIPIDKSGPNLLAPSDTINGIKSLKPDLVCLSNNHILDYGLKGLENTLNILSGAEIQNIGIIDNFNETSKTYYTEKEDCQLAVLIQDGPQVCQLAVYFCSTGRFVKPGSQAFGNLRSRCAGIVLPDHAAF